MRRKISNKRENDVLRAIIEVGVKGIRGRDGVHPVENLGLSIKHDLDHLNSLKRQGCVTLYLNKRGKYGVKITPKGLEQYRIWNIKYYGTEDPHKPMFG